MKVSFSDEKLLDIDEIYNSQNAKIWTPSRTEVDAKGGITRVQKVPKKTNVMVWLGVCSKGVSFFDEFRRENH